MICPDMNSKGGKVSKRYFNITGLVGNGAVIAGQYRIGFFDLIGVQVVRYTVFSQLEADNISCAIFLFTCAVAIPEELKGERLACHFAGKEIARINMLTSFHQSSPEFYIGN
jgi:hypothetical protein